MDYNLLKLWIILYTCNLYNIINQLYFNKKKGKRWLLESKQHWLYYQVMRGHWESY